MAKRSSRIIKPVITTGNRIKPPDEAVDYEKCPPIFSLEKLQEGKYCLQSLDKDDKAMFAEAIFRRKNQSWEKIKTCPRHGLGFEKIKLTSIRAAIPDFITPDVDHLLAFRFSGKKPMVGYRKRDIFYVLWFDNNYTLYPH